MTGATATRWLLLIALGLGMGCGPSAENKLAKQLAYQNALTELQALEHQRDRLLQSTELEIQRSAKLLDQLESRRNELVQAKEIVETTGQIPTVVPSNIGKMARESEGIRKRIDELEKQSKAIEQQIAVQQTKVDAAKKAAEEK